MGDMRVHHQVDYGRPPTPTLDLAPKAITSTAVFGNHDRFREEFPITRRKIARLTD